MREFMTKLTRAICGAKSLPRTEVTKKIWVYIKSHKLNEALLSPLLLPR